MPCIRPWISRLIYTITLTLIGFIGWASVNDPETFWAPGHLSRSHTDIKQCSQCHQPFEGPTLQKCMSCHPFVQFDGHSSPRTRAFHKSRIERGQPCVSCHTEHQGILTPITTGVQENPHGEFIFRVTGTTACSDCHAVESQENVRYYPVLHNERIQHLLAQGEGAHRSGHFARCLDCHVGGQAGSEGNDD